MAHRFAAAFVISASLSIGESNAPGGPTPWNGQPGVRESITSIMAREQSESTKGRIRQVRPEFDIENLVRRNQASAIGKQQTFNPAAFLSLTSATVVTGTSFIAASYSDSGSVPPDSTGDIGPTQYLLCINGRIRTFNRSGVADEILDTTTTNFFDSVRGTGDTADPRVRYDRLSGRWFISMLSYDTPTRIVLAVSSESNIASGTNFTFFYLAFSEVGATPNSDTGSFYDFDTLGIDRNALYIGGSVFDPSGPFYVGSTGFVINKAGLLAGNLIVTAFRQMASNSILGPYSPQGVDNDDPNSNEGYFIGVDLSTNNRLFIRRISNPGGAPSISPNISVTVPITTQPKGGVLALGSSFPLQDLDNRLFQARMRNGHLITGHTIEVNSSGTPDSAGERDAFRWYDIINLTTMPTLAQFGTLFDPSSSNTRSYWMPSAAMSGQSHIAFGCNVAATNEYPEIAAAWHLNTDSAGTTGAISLVQSATANANDLENQFNQHRWGDYSTMSLDPNDDMTFWTTQEYSTAPNSWAVRVVQIKGPPPATANSASPLSVARGQFDTDVSITGLSTSGSGFFDAVSTFPNHIAGSVSGSGVIVNRVSFSDPTHLTMNLTVSATAALGSRSITITNPDAQSASSAAGIITIDNSVDSDGDGIPDWWMIKYFGHATGQSGDKSGASDDADGDGFTNLQEFIAHTNPRDATSVFRITAIQPAIDGMHVTFASISGKSYRLERTDSLTNANWSTAVNNVTGLNGTTTAIDPSGIGPTRRFYRVVAIP